MRGIVLTDEQWSILKNKRDALQTLLNCATEAGKKEGNMHDFITAARIRGGLNNLCPSGENINDLVIYLE